MSGPSPTSSDTLLMPLAIGGLVPGALLRNPGEPIRLVEVSLCGFSAEAAQGGGQVRVLHRAALTSDTLSFHRLVESLESVLVSLAQQAGIEISLARADTVLLVMRPDNTAELWMDTAAVMLKMVVKRSVPPGTAVFESDIADVTAMRFPCVEIGPLDRVLCLFREAWRFGLAFDFNPEGNLSLQEFERTLGTLHRRLKYRHLYDTVADVEVFGRLVEAGWFPFVEIIGSEFRALTSAAEAGFSLAEAEASLVAKFGPDRLERMFERWAANPHFSSKASILRSAVNSYNAREPVAVLKIVLTEIEGILAIAHRAATGVEAKLKGLLAFALQAAEQKAGGPDTLLLPAAFARYLDVYTFANFDPSAGPATTVSRHAVGHGASDAGAYTQTRALQALLTLDQLAFGI